MTATAGGKGLNVARVARILGERVVASGLSAAVTVSLSTTTKIDGIESRFVPIDGNKDMYQYIG